MQTDAATPQVAFRQNHLLASLPEEELQTLLAESRLDHLPVGKVLFEPNEVVQRVYFPVSGVISMVTTMMDGSVIELATIGREGICGMPMTVGPGGVAHVRTMSQVVGDSISIRAEIFRQELRKGGRLASVADQYAQALFMLTGQNAACNRLHTIDQRCARWLLMTHDRVGADQFGLTQEFLSQMLGSRRVSVTLAASSLQELGAITYQRGLITVVDRSKLEDRSCECYDVITNVFKGLYQTQEASS
ncbi:MAG TPA: Crp/Fnr family transcriptional regulator [Actinomycetota bacterium]|nr:Crp/Fnr family transcriptional regulator [Actinomycetota bacterium]